MSIIDRLHQVNKVRPLTCCESIALAEAVRREKINAAKRARYALRKNIVNQHKRERYASDADFRFRVLSANNDYYKRNRNAALSSIGFSRQTEKNVYNGQSA